MHTQHPAAWLSKKHLLGAGVVTAVLTTVALSSFSKPRHEAQYANVPIPFLAGDNSLKASIEYYGTRYGIDVYEVTYESGELSEWLLPNRIHLVRVPKNPDIVPKRPLDEIIASIDQAGANVDYFGYKYLSADAIFEITARHDPDFADRFPGRFFASQTARVRAVERGEPLEDFEASHSIVFHPTDGSFPNADMIPDSLWVVVVNEPGGSRFSPVVSLTCGNGVVEGSEECDDGAANGTEESACNTECLYKIPIPPITGSSSSSAVSSLSSSSSSSETSSSSSTTSSSSSSTSSSSSSSNSTSSSSSSSTSSLEMCGGFAGNVCPEGDKCEDDPEDGCDPEVHMDCIGYCVPLTCDDGNLDEREDCDDGNENHYDSCNNYCQLLEGPF